VHCAQEKRSRGLIGAAEAFAKEMYPFVTASSDGSMAQG
jgi:hypothetical protein